MGSLQQWEIKHGTEFTPEQENEVRRLGITIVHDGPTFRRGCENDLPAVVYTKEHVVVDSCIISSHVGWKGEFVQTMETMGITLVEYCVNCGHVIHND